MGQPDLFLQAVMDTGSVQETCHLYSPYCNKCVQHHRGDQEGVARRMSGSTQVGLLNWLIRRD